MAETELMPKLAVGYTELGGGKLKKSNGFLKPNFGVLPRAGLAALLGCKLTIARMDVRT